jgi:hypothetical protein
MELRTFILVAFISISVAYISLKFFFVFPAWKNFHIQKSKASLAKCLKLLNSDALPNGRISNGDYLHDRFYKMIFDVLMSDEHKITIYTIKNFKHSKNEEERRKEFRAEIERLDKETRVIIDNAIFSLGKIVFLQNLLVFPMLIFKGNIERKKYKEKFVRSRVMRSAEYLTVREGDDCLA